MAENELPGADGPQFISGAGAGPTLVQIADRVINRPLLLHPTKAEVILHVLEGRLPLDSGALAPLAPDASRFVGSPVGADGKRRAYMMDKGVAVISVIGSLVNRGAWIGANSGMTSYEGIAAQLRMAAADPEAKSIVLDLDSPGGEATGMFTVASLVAETAKKKPVVAVVNDMAASAAYGIASQASEIVVSPTSIVGSIGVVLTHLDRSGEMERKGIKPTLIYAGRNKVDGNPYGPLTDAVKADLQAEVAKFYDQFVGLVAQGRGDRLTDVDARATEARTFIGQDAIDRGLADRMAPLEAVISSLQSEPKPGASRAPKKEPFAMSEANTAPQAGITKEAHEAALVAARAEGQAEGRKAGAKDATDRIGAILRSEQAKGREAMAMTLALDTDMSAEAADKVLASAPVAAPQSQADRAAAELAARSAAVGSFGASAPIGSKPDAANDGWASAVNNANRQIGVKS